jgi:hypothetical protein
MPHHRVLTRAPVDYGPRSGNARPSDWRTSTTVQSGPKARHNLSAGFVVCAASNRVSRTRRPRGGSRHARAQVKAGFN